MTQWVVEQRAGAPAQLHRLGLPAEAVRTVRFCRSDRAAIVLGRAQPADHLDLVRASAAGLAVVRRASGGGAVLVGPGSGLWVDVALPAEDRLWDADVGRSMWWLGAVWARALHTVGVAGARVHHGTMVRRPWSDRVCFAGLADGEVAVGDRKVVGVSQRRTRAGALLQCAVPFRWDPAALVVAGLVPPGAAGDLIDVAVGLEDLGPGMDAGELEAAFLAELATA